MWPDLKSDGFERVVNMHCKHLVPFRMDGLWNGSGLKKFVLAMKTLNIWIADSWDNRNRTTNIQLAKNKQFYRLCPWLSSLFH